jgi:eukaryotic-like serine/threonine-protein kinase
VGVSTFQLRVLGGFALEGPSGASVPPLPQRRAKAVLAVLAVCGDLGSTRERLLALLWPESDEAHSRHGLRDALLAIRHTLGPGAVRSVGDLVRLDPTVVGTDVRSFLQALGSGQHADAVRGYGGPLLEGFHVDDAPEFERWLDGERARLAREYGEALERLATAAERAGAWEEAVGWWGRAVEHDPLNSHLVLQHVQALAAIGDRANAIRAADLHARRLRAELDLEPDREVLAKIDGIRRGALPAPRDRVPRFPSGAPANRPQTAEVIRADLAPQATPSGDTTSTAARRPLVPLAVRRHPLAAFGTTALIGVLGGVLLLSAFRRSAKVHWAREQAMTQLRQLVDSGYWEAAYQLALRATAVIPGDSLLTSLLQRVATPVRIRSAPAGARVYRRPYAATDTAWQYLGTTPVDSVWLPGVWSVPGFWVPTSYSRVKLEKPGYRALEAAFTPFLPNTFVLDDGHTFPPGMVGVSGGEFGVDLPQLDHLAPIRLADFFIDVHEVTNREYKRFVETGGYQQRARWTYSFSLDGRRLSWEVAMARFKDKTGRPGPATWEAGDYPPEQADYPVTGVSWYEAAAYAKFVGKELPTIWHWSRAAGTSASAAIVPASNIAGKGPARVGAYPGVGPYGTYDMAGNAREWCWNETAGQRYILGGGWNDLSYAFNNAYTQPPFDRSPTNGFRLVTYNAADSNLAAAKRPVHAVFRDYTKERPVPDRIFEIYRRLYDYDRTPLRAEVEERDTNAADWVRERISFDAAYGHERVIAYLFLPKRGHAPYQTLVYFPGSFAIFARSLVSADLATFDFILKSGRALMAPVYKSTYERRHDLPSHIPNVTNLYKDHVIMWAKDLRRSTDYLETRPDINTKKLAYYGVSWGGSLGGLMPAVEPRFRAVVLYIAGLRFQKPQPEVDPFNFLPHIKMPVLMLNGRYDQYFPLETSARPMFRWLGPAQKRQVISDDGHIVPRLQLIKETLDWLDRYLGPVK